MFNCLQDYALEHVFSAYGTVEFVRLQSDARYGVVQVMHLSLQPSQRNADSKSPVFPRSLVVVLANI